MGRGGSTLTVSLTVKILFFLLTTALNIWLIQLDDTNKAKLTLGWIVLVGAIGISFLLNDTRTQYIIDDSDKRNILKLA